MSKSISLASLVLAVGLSMAMSADLHAAAATHRSIVRLFGPTIMKGKVTYEERPRFGSLLRRFKVQVERGVPFQTFPVFVNDVQVGTIATNAGGVGRFELRSPQFIDSPGDGQPMPADFPQLDTGDTVAVGPLQGTFWDARQSTSQRYRIDGKVQQGGFEVHVKYTERFKRVTLRRIFSVEVEGGAPGTYDVLVNGNLVGQVAVGSSGVGELELETPQFIEPGDDEVPMPASFPTLLLGDVVQVGETTVVMNDLGSVTGSDGGGGGGGNSGPGGGGGDDD